MMTSLTCSAGTFPSANSSLSSLPPFCIYGMCGTPSQPQTSRTKAPEGCHQGKNSRSSPRGRSSKLNQSWPILFFWCTIRSHSSFLPLSVSFYGAAWQVMIYTAGFPCQPYSLLSSTRKLLADANSRQLWAVLRNVKKTKPFDSRFKRIYSCHSCRIKRMEKVY